MHRSTIVGLTAFASALLAGACASIDPEPIDPVPTPAREAAPTPRPANADETADRDSDDTVAAAIERALAEGWQDLRILTDCIIDDGFESVEIFGSGVAIWGKNAQFTLTHDQIRQHLEALREADFAHFAGRYGGRATTGMELPVETGGKNVTRVTCRIELELDGVSKQVRQLHRGEQSPDLRRLAEEILDGCRESASSGTTAADLDDGLEKAAAGELAPETVDILFHHKPALGEDSEGWLLRLRGLEASSRTFRPGEGYTDVLLLELHPDDLADLLRQLAEQAPGELPINLYAEHYTDLKISVLDQRKSIQARQFADLTPTRHGEQQQRFDRIFGELQELHRRVMAAGRPEPQD